MDSAQFLETLAGNFMEVVQYNEDNRAFEVRSDKYYSLSVVARGRGRQGQLVWSGCRSAADLASPGSVAGSYEESCGQQKLFRENNKPAVFKRERPRGAEGL